MAQELECNKNALFVTLTFSRKNLYNLSKELYGRYPSNYTEENDICRLATRRWLERIRKKTKKSVKHWLITEKGEDYDRIHLHGIVWGDASLIEKWNYGFTFIGTYVNDKTIKYITKYILKTDEKHPGFKGKIMCSSGIGRNYEKSRNAKRNRYKGEETNEMYLLPDGTELPLPKYYHDKIYSEKERENLWIIKQERGYRYIAGEKVSTDNLEEWENLTRYYQKRAEELYGDNPEEWRMDRQKKKLEKMRAARRKTKLKNQGKGVDK